MPQASRRYASSRLLRYGLAVCGAGLATKCCMPSFVAPPGAARTVHPAEVAQQDVLLPASAAAAASLLVPAEAWAKGGVYGPLEGKVSSLVHPFVMAGLFLVTLYSGFAGWQWRQTRLVGLEINDLRKQIPKPVEGEEEKPEAPQVKELKDQIEKLTAERSELIKGQFKDKHHQISSVILGGGIFFTTYGVCNTWFRTEKLFPGPHLFAGAAVCVLWALAAALVPYMEKGNENARNAHIALNVVNLGLFTWQLPTGFEIFLKVVNNDKLPLF